MDNILFVCTGNTCRSPMAEGLFNKLAPSSLNLKATSAGVFTTDDLPPSENAIVACLDYDVDISEHKSRMIDEQAVRNAKYIICLTAVHYDRILERFPFAEGKLFTLSKSDIADPFGGNLELYKNSVKQIYDAILKVIKSLEQMNNE